MRVTRTQSIEIDHIQRACTTILDPYNYDRSHPECWKCGYHLQVGVPTIFAVTVDHCYVALCDVCAIGIKQEEQE